MKKLTVNSRGESLIESIISVTLLAILMMSVSVIVSAAVNVSRSTVASNAAAQATVNTAIYGDFTSAAETVSFSFSDAASGIDISSEIDVGFTSNEGIVSFYPEVVTSGP